MSRLPPITPPAQNRPLMTVVYLALATLTLIWLQSVFQGTTTNDLVPYSQFEQALSDGRIQ
jgi:predicted membrane channel-forming protein YqfA (hemolysin III family)